MQESKCDSKTHGNFLRFSFFWALTVYQTFEKMVLFHQSERDVWWLPL